MRTEGFRGALLSALVIASLIVPAISLLQISSISATPDGLVPHAPIYIDGNDNFTPANGVNGGGSGTVGDPYIIENYIIDASSDFGIEIRNTTDYFIVRNCLVENGHGSFGIWLIDIMNGRIENNTCGNNDFGISLYYSDKSNTLTNNTCENNLLGGILLYHSTNDTIENNTCENNSLGIYLSHSDNNTLSNNTFENNGYGIHLYESDKNTISNNTFENHFWYGISLTNSDNNSIYHNNLINITNQARDNSSNYWDNGYSSGGNYWSDYAGDDNYRGENQDILGSDGIGDTPYNIPGDGNQDHYPLMNPWGVGRNILVYVTEDGSGYQYDKTWFDGDLPAILGDHGYLVTVTDRNTTPEITSSLLVDYDELWILSTNPYSAGCFSNTEIGTILNFREVGNGLLIIADHGWPGVDYAVDANQISGPLGVTFYGVEDHGPTGGSIAPDFENHPLFAGVETIAGHASAGNMIVNDPVEVVATYQGDSLIAVLDGGSGRVVFDVSFTRLFDAGLDGDGILVGDTPQYVRNITDWLIETVGAGELNAEWIVGENWDSEPEYKDISHISGEVNPEDPHELVVTVTNAYPSIDYYLEIGLLNSGTIPLRVSNIEKEDDLPQESIIEFYIEEGIQINPGDITFETLHVHIDQDVEEDRTYTFTITVEVVQWNEPLGVTGITPTFWSQTLTISGTVNTYFSSPDLPTCVFTTDKTFGTKPLTVQFTDLSTGTITDWAWDFDGDGLIDSTVQNPIYTYEQVGTYNVSLTVSGPAGSDTRTKTSYIRVYGIEIIQPKSGDNFWIEAEPEPRMQTITCQAKVVGITPDPTATIEFSWEAKIRYTEYGRNDITIIGPKRVIGGSWMPDFGNIIAGGEMEIIVTATINGKSYQDMTVVYIKGKNPDPELVKESLGRLLLQAISYKESWPHHWWYQFHPEEVLGNPDSRYGLPEHERGEAGRGWGLMQITWMSTIADIWDWKQNINSGKDILRDGEKFSKACVKYFKNKYPEDKNKIKLSKEQHEEQASHYYNRGKLDGRYWIWDPVNEEWTVNPDVPKHPQTGLTYAQDIMRIVSLVKSGNPPEGWGTIINGESE